ncbi:MAG TPA: carbohydrate porin [Fibrobacteria bacterium]|nr:carbohydrate porin [Fibrobacteria bacterium]
MLFSLLALANAFASASDTAPDTRWTAHFQQTVIAQADPRYHADYSGPNSLDAHGGEATSLTSTLFLGARLWGGGEAYWNPEVNGGEGLGGSAGVAGFLNGETSHVTSVAPGWNWMARLFLRQTFDFGAPSDTLAEGQNQVATVVSDNRLVATLGKYCLDDIFDANAFSHDPRTQFINSALVSQGSWDYPADTHGYTYALSLEYYDGPWVLRGATAAMPTVGNGIVLDYRPGQVQGQVAEVERDYEALGKGAVRALAYWNLYHGGNYARALEDTDVEAGILGSRRYGRDKHGFGLDWDHQWTPNLGTFARAGWSDGQNENWAFTEIDQSISAGVQLSGATWGRARDKFGLAEAVDGISQVHQDFLARGGTGFVVGDGALSYAPESILEAYYAAALLSWLTVSGDYQFVANPAYNRDRGPVSIFAIRVHSEI